jgi:hypothetical protein
LEPLKRRNDFIEHYEAMTVFYWKFFRVSTLLIVVFIPLVFYLTVTKPA